MSGSAQQELVSLLGRTGLATHRTVVAVRSGDGTAVVVGVQGPRPGSPVGTNAVLYGASLTKQMVGVLISLLIEQAVLDVDSSVRTFLPQLPSWAEAISLRHLLHHTAGLPPTSALLSHLGLDGEQHLDNSAVLAALAEQERPARPPGIRFEYSNVGYVCLAEVLNRVTRESLPALARQRLFEPLEMNRSELGPAPAGVAIPEPSPPRTVGDGGLWTTAEDLLRWNDALNRRHFGRSVHERCDAGGHLDDGTPLNYGWGVRVVDHRGERTITHGGSWPGSRSKTVRQPRRATSVALITSCDDDALVSDTALEIARWSSRTIAV